MPIDVQATLFVEAENDEQADAILKAVVSLGKDFPELPVVRVLEVARWEVEA